MSSPIRFQNYFQNLKSIPKNSPGHRLRLKYHFSLWKWKCFLTVTESESEVVTIFNQNMLKVTPVGNHLRKWPLESESDTPLWKRVKVFKNCNSKILEIAHWKRVKVSTALQWKRVKVMLCLILWSNNCLPQYSTKICQKSHLWGFWHHSGAT